MKAGITILTALILILISKSLLPDYPETKVLERGFFPSQLLKIDDYVVSTHRAHGHYIAKGGDIKKMIAELYGKSNGCSNGYGGSMHLIDLKVNFMGITAIVGNSLPVGAGLALSIQLEKTKKNNISCIFIGEGCTEEGVFHETVNFCAQHKLPVLVVRGYVDST